MKEKLGLAKNRVAAALNALKTVSVRRETGAFSSIPFRTTASRLENCMRTMRTKDLAYRFIP